MASQIRNCMIGLILFVIATTVLAVPAPATLEEISADVEGFKNSAVETGSDIWKRSANAYAVSSDWISGRVDDTSAAIKRSVEVVNTGTGWVSSGYEGAKSFFGRIF